MPKKSLDEQIIELEDKIDTPIEEVEIEQEENPEVATEEVTEEVEEPTEEKTEDKPEIKAEVKEEPKIDANLAYMLREEKRKREDAERKNEELLRSVNQPKKSEDLAPNAEEDPIGYLAWENRQLAQQVKINNDWREKQESERKAQELEISGMQTFDAESEAIRAQVPDVDQAAEHVYKQLASAQLALNPNMPPKMAGDIARKTMLEWSNQYRAQGLNAAHAIRLVAEQRYGYTTAKEDPKPEPTKIPKASLETIEKNKNKSASGLGTGSTKSNVITPEAFSKMSIADMELHKDELEAAGFSI